MIYRKSNKWFTVLALLLSCTGCSSTRREVTGNRSWLGYLRYGSDDTPVEKTANREAREIWWGNDTATITASGSPLSPPAKSLGKAAETELSPGTALAELAGNKFEGPWTVSRIPIGPDRPAFEKDDRVKVKASPDGPTMTVEYVPSATFVDARYYSESLKESLKRTMRYRCRWKNKDGSESVGGFLEEELESVPVGG